jgi:type IV pilus assembly protein PilA
MREQQVITNGQMNANLVNKYLTKDLEECKELIEPVDINKSIYDHIIKKDNDEITYKVIKSEKGNKEYYNLVRESSKGSKIDIIINQQRNSEDPFIITLDDFNKNIYEVTLDYNENKKLKTYEFDVTSRFFVVDNENSGENEPGDSESDIGDIRFGYESIYNNKDKIRTSIDPKKNGNQNQEIQPKEVDKKENYNINVSIDRQSGKSYSQIDGNIATSNHNLFKDKDINSIKFRMINNIAIDLEASIKYKNNSTPLNIKLIRDANGVKDAKTVPITSKEVSDYIIYSIPSYYSKKQESITIKGTIKRLNDGNSGELIIQLGEDLN